jgi:hypothetical protein
VLIEFFSNLLEQRIRELGGKVPPRWLHDTDGQYRNVELLEEAEKLWI